MAKKDETLLDITIPEIKLETFKLKLIGDSPIVSSGTIRKLRRNTGEDRRKC